MDPLSITAGAIAVVQLIDMITAIIKRYADAPEEISSLESELDDLRPVLYGLESTVHSLSAKGSLDLEQLANLKADVRSFNHILRELEELLGDVSRITWVQKRRKKAKNLRKRLRRTKESLTLHISAINM